jgi:predicted nucleotidyltransferase
VTLFGSFARGNDGTASDLDVVVVRPGGTIEDDPAWNDSILRWETHARRISGNTVNRIEVSEEEIPPLMRSRRPLWQAIRREGKLLLGTPLTEIGTHARA